ncbi:transcriptional regulator, GntR family [Variovorax sp. YR752]|uniref:GntR family transcriptional regulator n=1 Tax=Variovorax sp. YR752 TaxID=1884383 RepID=UPI000BD73B9D|nr:GntR family transcriptional regulator [Variovorax sp. YR752]SOE06195.1 transcriptional regulator, GntR family [Variovorax sp. YR752]
MGESALDASPRSSLLEELRMKIVSGQIGPGEILTVPTLAKAWGVSTTPVREILLELAGVGLLEARRNRGFQVKRPTVTDMKELFALRAQLEAYALSCIASVTPEECAALRLQARAIEEAVNRRNTLKYLETDRVYHLHLVGLARNRRLLDMIMNLRDNMRLYGIDSDAGLRRQQISVPEHYRIVDLLEANDTAQAIELMKRHILDWEPVFVDAIVDID